MINAVDLKGGTTFLMDNKPYRVEDYSHQKIARGGGTVKLSVRNLETGILEKKTINSSSKFNEVNTVKKPLKYLYKDSDVCVFMDMVTFEQTEIPIQMLDDVIQFIKENQTVNVLFINNKAVSIHVPPKVNLEVVEASPGVKGDSATNIYKPALLETKMKLKVPLFIKKGDVICVDTRTGEYVARVTRQPTKKHKSQ